MELVGDEATGAVQRVGKGRGRMRAKDLFSPRICFPAIVVNNLEPVQEKLTEAVTKTSLKKSENHTSSPLGKTGTGESSKTPSTSKTDPLPETTRASKVDALSSEIKLYPEGRGRGRGRITEAQLTAARASFPGVEIPMYHGPEQGPAPEKIESKVAEKRPTTSLPETAEVSKADCTEAPSIKHDPINAQASASVKTTAVSSAQRPLSESQDLGHTSASQKKTISDSCPKKATTSCRTVKSTVCVAPDLLTMPNKRLSSRKFKMIDAWVESTIKYTGAGLGSSNDDGKKESETNVGGTASRNNFTLTPNESASEKIKGSRFQKTRKPMKVDIYRFDYDPHAHDDRRDEQEESLVPSHSSK